MPRLSVVVITRDEERNLPGLLESVRPVADEVVVVDSGSADRTVELARAAGARVLHRDFQDYGSQRLFAVSQARNDFVLSLDGDERLSPELAAAIRAEMARPDGAQAAGYRVHFRHVVFGKPARFGPMWRDRRVRLFDRRRANFDGAPVHERVLVDGPVADLPGRCDHEGFRTPEEARRKLARYAEVAARARFRRGARFRPWHWLRWPAGFAKRYLLRLGFLDGATGLELALLYAGYDLEKSRALRRLERAIGRAGRRSDAAERLRSAGRRAAVALAALALPRPRAPLPPLPEIRRVLVVRTDERVGNQLLTTPLLRALARGLPAAEIHLLAPPRHAAVVPRTSVDRLVPFEKRLFFRRPWRFLAMLRSLRRERYDVVVEAAHWSGFSLTASLLTRLAATRCSVGHDRGGSARFLSHPVAHDAANENDVRAKLELLRPLGLLPAGLEPETELGLDPEAARRALAAAGLAPPFALLNPGARRAERRWPPETQAAVAKGLARRGLPVLVVWGPGEEALARAVARAAGAQLAPPTDLETLAALLRRARLCVSNNSGPMHLAVAAGTPTVGIFLHGEAARWGHDLPWFLAAEPRSETDAAGVLELCDRLLERPVPPARPSA